MAFQLSREGDITSWNMVAFISVQASNPSIPAKFKETCTDTMKVCQCILLLLLTMLTGLKLQLICPAVL